MGVVLVGHGEESFNWSAWRALFQIAVSFGWKPAGTLPPEDSNGVWNAGIFPTILRQSPTPMPAHLLALNRALSAMTVEQSLTEEQSRNLHGMSEQIRRLADFCSRGGFLIY
jgi:hypothetical protein